MNYEEINPNKRLLSTIVLIFGVIFVLLLLVYLWQTHLQNNYDNLVRSEIDKQNVKIQGVAAILDGNSDRIESINTVLQSISTTQSNLISGEIGLSLSSEDSNGLNLKKNILGLDLASANSTGALSSGDWNSFNGKENTLAFGAGLTRNSSAISSNLSTGISGGQSIYGGTAAGNNLIIDSTTNSSKGYVLLNPSGGNVGIGTTTPTSILDITGTTATDGPTYSEEFLTSSDWTSADWTGNFTSGWSHTTGNTTPLSQSKPAVVGTKYQIVYTVTNRTAGSFALSFGGRSFSGKTASGTFGPTATTASNLIITPGSTFDGTIVISIKSITLSYSPILTLRSSDGASIIEMRTNSQLDNAFFGTEAGKYNTSGILNAAFGSHAFEFNTSGYDNAAFGYAALSENTTGWLNTAIGYQSLRYNITGGDNTSVGGQSMTYNYIGGNNTAVGFASLHLSGAGNYNTAIGGWAGYHNETGDYNTVSGHNALYFNTTGYSNSAYGKNSLWNILPTSGGISAIEDYGSIVPGTVKAISVGHGLAGTSTKEISGTVNYDGSKSITVIDADSFYFTNTFLGSESTGWWSIDTEGRYNTAIGEYSGGSIVTGSSNTFIGRYAGNNALQLESAENSMALGYGAYTTASNQVVIGNSSVTATGIGTSTPAHALDVTGDCIALNGVCLNSTAPSNLVTYVGGTLRFSTTSTQAINLTRYLGAYGTTVPSSDTVGTVITQAGTLEDFYVRADANTNNGITSINVLKNGVSALTIPLGASATSASDIVSSIAVAAGDRISIQIVTLGTSGTLTRPMVSFNHMVSTSVFSSQWTTSGLDISYVTGNVGIGTASPNANAILDLTSTTKAFLPPRMTTAQRDAISSPTAGMTIYNTSTNKLNIYTTVWEEVTSAP